MKMKGLLKRVSTLALAGLMAISLCVTSFAGENTGELGKILKQLEALKDSTNSGEKDLYEAAVETWNGIAEDSDGDATVTFAGTTKRFRNIGTEATDEKNATYIAAYNAMSAHAKNIGASTTDVKTVEGAKQELKGMTDTLGMGADINQGQKALSSIAPLVQRVTGILVIVVLLGMAVFTAFDVAYLVFPVAKNGMDSMARSGGSAVSKTDSNTGEAKFRWVSDDAIQAYQTATEVGHNPLFVYLKKRLISYIAVSIVVFMLMTGNLAVVVNFVLTMLDSVFGMFGELTAKK